MNLLSAPKIKDWWNDNYKKLAQNSNNYLVKAFEEGLLDGQTIIKQDVISDGDSSVVYYVETNDNRYVVKFTPAKGELTPLKLFFEEWANKGLKHLISIK